MRSALEKWSSEEFISSDWRGVSIRGRTLPLLQRGRFRFRSHNFTARDDEAQVEPNAHLWWRRVQEAGRLPVLQERHRAGGEPRRRRTCDASLGSSAGGSQALWQRGSGVLSAVSLGLISRVSLALNDATSDNQWSCATRWQLDWFIEIHLMWDHVLLLHLVV